MRAQHSGKKSERLLKLPVRALLGPRYAYSDTWQLAINTGTTIITFLMVFIIQNTQNREARSLQLKLDELIRAVKEARTGLVRLEELTDEELVTLTADFERLREGMAAEGRGPTSRLLHPRSAIEEIAP